MLVVRLLVNSELIANRLSLGGVKSYTQIFYCAGYGAPNIHVA